MTNQQKKMTAHKTANKTYKNLPPTRQHSGNSSPKNSVRDVPKTANCKVSVYSRAHDLSFCIARGTLSYRLSSLCVSDNFFLMFPCVFISFAAAGNMQGKKGGKLNPVLPCMIQLIWSLQLIQLDRIHPLLDSIFAIWV